MTTKPRWEYSEDLIPRKCPDLVDRKISRSFKYPGCMDNELVSEMQTCMGRMCIAYFLDDAEEPMCKKYGGPVFIKSLEALARELDKEDEQGV